MSDLSDLQAEVSQELRQRISEEFEALDRKDMDVINMSRVTQRQIYEAMEDYIRSAPHIAHTDEFLNLMDSLKWRIG